MREARIILPVGAADTAHQWLAQRLARDFGGYTKMSQGCGAWLSDQGRVVTEQVEVYDVAVPNEPRSDWALQSIVAGLFDRTAEQAIYVRGRDGEVTIIERPVEVKAA